MPPLSRRAMLIAGATAPLLPTAKAEPETPLTALWHQYQTARATWQTAHRTHGDDAVETETTAQALDALIDRLAQAPAHSSGDVAIKLAVLVHLWGLDCPTAKPEEWDEWLVMTAWEHSP